MSYGSNLENSLKTLAAIKAKLEQAGIDDAEALQLIQSNKNQIVKALLHCNARPFIVAPSQLDCTQPEDFGYGTAEWRIEWEKIEKRERKKEFPHKLSTYRNLCYKVTAKKDLLHSRNTGNLLGILPEFSREGSRRCCFVKSNGMRCMAYAPAPVCHYHANLVASVPYMNDRFLSAIKNEGLKDAYLKNLNDPNRRSVESELALMRTMLNILVSRIDVATDLQDLPMDQIGGITVMCQKITGTVEQMTNIETKLAMRLSIEQVTNLLLTVASKLIDIVQPTPDQCLKIAEVIENLPVRRLATETIQGNAEYGVQADATPVKNSNAQFKYTEDGTVTPNAFTPEQVKLEKEWVNDKFKPAQAAYKAKMDLLQQNNFNAEQAPE